MIFKKKITVFSLIMLNVIAVDSLRSIPFAAKYGFSLVFFYLIGALCFFIPTALVSAELSTGWPEQGGIYIWTKKAFGKKWGMIAIWIQWVYNIVWFPVILSLISTTIAYIINPSLIYNKNFIAFMVLFIFSGTTILNSYGIYASYRLTNISAILGSIFPIIIIAIIGSMWIYDGKPSQIKFDWNHFFPHISSIGSLVLLTNVLFSLVGIEMSSIHIKDVENPKKSYPKALFWSSFIILITLIGGSLSIAVVLPKDKIELLSGMLQILDAFCSSYHIKYIKYIIPICIILGGIGSISAWILGPSKGIMVSSKDGIIPKFLSKCNKYNAPVGVLRVQFLIFLFIWSIYWFMPNVSSSFWILSNITAILSFIPYIFIFLSIIFLRYKFPNIKRAYKIPGGILGVSIISFLGIITCLITIIIGFIPPDGIDYGSLWRYELILCFGIFILLIIPFVYNFIKIRIKV